MLHMYVVNNFLVFLSIAYSSLFLQLKNAAEYLNRDTAQVLNPRTKFPPFSFDLKTFLNLLIYSFEIFNFIFSSKIYLPLKFLNTCNFHLPINDLIALPSGNSIATDFTIFLFSITNIAHFSIPNSIPISSLKT